MRALVTLLGPICLCLAAMDLPLVMRAQTPAADIRQLWIHEPAKSIDHWALTPDRQLLVMTDDGIAVLDAASGNAVWSRNDIGRCRRMRNTDLVQFRHGVRCRYAGKFELGFETIPGEPWLVGQNPEDGQFAVVDLSSGRTLYEGDGRTPGKVRDYVYHQRGRRLLMWIERASNAYSFASIDEKGQLGAQSDSPIVNDLVWLGTSDAGATLVYGKDRDGKRVIAELGVDGRVAWHAAGWLNEDIEDGPTVVGGGGRWRQKPYQFTAPEFDTATTAVLFITEDGPLRLSRDGKLLWKAQTFKGKKPSAVASTDGAVLVADDKEVVGIDPNSGSVLWRYKGRTALSSIESHPRGVLIWSEGELDLVNPRTGARLWTQAAALPEGWRPGNWFVEDFRPDYRHTRSPRHVSGDTAYIAGASRLVSVNLEDGRVQSIAGYAFPGNYPVTSLELLGDDFVITRQDTIARLDRQGQVKFQRSYQAVGDSAGQRAGAIVGFLLSPFATPDAMHAAFARRYAVNADDEQYEYFLFENAGDDEQRRFGIVSVERSTGRETGTLWVKQRNPNVLYDEVSRTVYYQEDDKRIRVVRFLPPQ